MSALHNPAPGLSGQDTACIGQLRARLGVPAILAELERLERADAAALAVKLELNTAGDSLERAGALRAARDVCVGKVASGRAGE